METDLYKIRSIPACIKATYTLFNDNFKTIFKRTWLPILVNTLLLSVFISFYIIDMSSFDMLKSIAIICMIGSVVASIWLYSVILNLFNNHSVKQNMYRTSIISLIKIGVLIILLGLVFTLRHLSVIYSVPITIALVLALITVGLPLNFAIIKYLMTRDTSLKHLFTRDYRIGWRYWGTLFTMALLVGIISIVLIFIAAIPLMIILFAQHLNTLGMAGGDPSGTPAYFPYLIFVVSTVVIAITFYILTWSIMVDFYTFGNIEERERERLQAQNNTNIQQ